MPISVERGRWWMNVSASVGDKTIGVVFNYRVLPVALWCVYAAYHLLQPMHLPWWVDFLILAFIPWAVKTCWLGAYVARSWLRSVVCIWPPLFILNAYYHTLKLGDLGWVVSLVVGMFLGLYWNAGRVESE